MNIKMIVCDLDGTLLRSDKSVSQRTTAVLTQCKTMGIKLVYATGRGEGDTASLIPPGLFDGGIFMNGATAYAGDRRCYSCMIPFDTARPILMACDKRGVDVSAENGGMHYANFKLTDRWSYLSNYKIVDFAKHDMDSGKLLIVLDNADDVSFITEYVDKHLPDDLYCVISKENIAMIMHKKATKAEAAKALAGYWNIERSDIAAFGDDLNDIEMIKYAGAGIAMDGALPKVKLAADYICGIGDEDGVAKWIEKNIQAPCLPPHSHL